MAQGKKYVDASKKYDKAELHEPAEAFGLVKSLASRNFDETVEVAFKLGVDPRKADQMLRSTVSLPAGTGKDAFVARARELAAKYGDRFLPPDSLIG